ncbi:thioesterase family protein [Nonomuraea sp. NPDC026600]|uniref:acyl-CoA thioesterase n=1 Tax=Nonomuraea sp. NPDC026600 TaxID=3155363 RepID=UPI0033D246FB
MSATTEPHLSADTRGDGWFSIKRRIGWTEVDPSSNYQFSSALQYVEEAEIALFREAGVLGDLYPHLPRTHVTASYVRPARFDDLITVQVKVSRVGRSSVDLDFRILLDETVCAHGVLGSAYVDPATGTSTPVPEHVRARLGFTHLEA